MAELSLMQLSEDNKDIWDDYVSSNLNAYVYHLWEWGDILCKTYNLRRWYLVVKEKQQIVGVLPVFYVRSLLFAEKIISLPFCEYGGPLLADYISPSMAENVLKLLIKNVHVLATKLRTDYIELRQPSISFSTFASSTGFRLLQRYVTFRMDLTLGESRIWKNFDRRTRHAVKKAMRIGTKIQEVDVGSLEHYYDLYLRTQKTLGSPPHAYAFFRNLYDAFMSKGLLQMLLAVYQGKPIAGVMVFCFNGRLYWWNNVLDRRYAGLNPTNLLLWHVIRLGMENNFKVLDLGRTRLEDVGVHHFKSGWGGKEVGLEDYVFLLRSVRIPDPLQRRYAFLSKFWSLLPQTFVRKVGPLVVAEIGL